FSERGTGVARLEHPPFVAVASFVADRGIAGLRRAIVCHDTLNGRWPINEEIAPHEVQALVTDGFVLPQHLAHRRVDAVSANDDISFRRSAPPEFDDDTAIPRVQADDSMIQLQHARR